MIKGIIFDFGGTLDTGGTHWSRVIKQGWEKAGVAANDALFREAYVFGEQELERTETILPHHTFNDVLRIKITLELQYLAQTGNFPPAQVEAKAAEIAQYCYGVAREGIAESVKVLEELSKKYPLVMVSNFYGNLDTVLKEFGIDIYFKKVIESEKEGIRKPDASLLKLGVKALDLKPEEILVVGDSIKNDIEPAETLGCHTLLLEGKGWDDTPLQHLGPSIKKLAEMLKYVEDA